MLSMITIAFVTLYLYQTPYQSIWEPNSKTLWNENDTVVNLELSRKKARKVQLKLNIVLQM